MSPGLNNYFLEMSPSAFQSKGPEACLAKMALAAADQELKR
jgi:hypothetical protein